MSRKSDQLDRIEETVARLEGALADLARVLGEHGNAIRAEVKGARSAAEAAAGAVQGLAAVVGNPERGAPLASSYTVTEGQPASRGRRATRSTGEQGNPTPGDA